MEKAICDLACIPMRREPSDKSEMVNQLLFGETMDVLDSNDKWLMVSLHHDQYQGWIDRKQVRPVESAGSKPRVASMFFAAKNENGTLQFLPSGSLVWDLEGMNFRCGTKKMELVDQSAFSLDQMDVVQASFIFHGSPYLWGGRTMFGMDCSGFTQIVYRLCGKWIHRDSIDQATQGETVDFLNQSVTGDLAFFDNPEGKITHVGIILRLDKSEDRSIIHCSGQVRIDKVDTHGIYNAEDSNYSHKLRIIKRVL